MKEEIKKAYKSVSIPPEDKERIYAGITDASRHRKKEHGVFRGLTRAAAVVFCVLAAAGTVYAASKLLTAGEAVSKLDGSDKLVSKFDALGCTAYETKKDGVYEVTYLGMVSGKNLSRQGVEDTDGKKSYYVAAVERTDGKKITEEESGRIVVSPFVKGEAPWQCNIYTLGGSRVSQRIEGVLYCLYECDSVDIFADRGVYLGVMDGGAPSSEQYSFDSNTGEIKANNSYKGLNLLFHVQIDPSKADPEEAEKYLQQQDEDDEEVEEGDTELSKWQGLSLDEVLSKGKLISDSVRKVKPDKEGYYKYESDHGSLTCGLLGEVGEKAKLGGFYTDDEHYIVVGELNEDSSITFMLYDVEMLEE